MKIWLFLLALVVELLSFYILLGADLSTLNWGYYMALHLVACVTFTWSSWLLLPHRYKFPIWSSSAFLFCLSFCMSLFGMLGGGGILAALHRPNVRDPITWVECEQASSSVPSDQCDEHHAPHYGAGALRDILMHNLDPVQRLQAVNFVYHLPVQQSIPLLQLALKDLSDDVRLFSYASLEAMEAKINVSIARLKSQFVRLPEADIAFNIAQQYWELCYLELAESVLCSHYLEQASWYLIRSNQIAESATSNVLLGRIMLAQENPKKAIRYLTRAFDAGLLKEQVVPYLAEASFALGNYELTKYYMAQLPTHEHDRLQQLKEYWLC